MSTKRTLKVQLDDTGAGFHLYQDTEELDDDGNGPVHLDLENVTFEIVHRLRQVVNVKG